MTEGSHNLIRAKKLYRISFYCIVFTLLMTLVFGVIRTQSGLKDLLIGLPALICFFCAPAGLFFSIRSYLKKEPDNKAKLMYFIGNAFFTLLFLLMFIAFMSDMRQFFK